MTDLFLFNIAIADLFFSGVNIVGEFLALLQDPKSLQESCMTDPKYAGAPYPPQPSAPIHQAQPGYGPPHQGGVPPGYQGGAPPGYQGGNAPPVYQSGGPPGYQGGSAPPGYQTVPTTTTHVIVRGGNCPACNIGHTNTEFTILGICLAIVFFPIGILCCLLLTEKRCNNCGMTYT
ncbi:hypothetical protein QZH41_002323 [Actinostola sp. cb2023]|nr:hypothetical protein QZH41_002323 [Actinostola sp. cb2023]